MVTCRRALLSVIFSGASLISWAQDDFPFLAGACEIPIVPFDTAYIAGHTNNRIFNGVNDSIYVKAFVISDKTTSLAILTFDCIGLLYPQLLEIRNLIAERLPDLPVSHIAMSSTHTHSGPDVVGLWGPDLFHSGVDSIYMDSLVNRSVRCLELAWHSRVAVKGEYALGEHGVDWVFNISEPDQLDRSLTAIRFTDRSGKAVATLANFACHPTFLDAVNDQVSSDYIGGFYDKMNSMQGGINFFLQGSIGGWVQPEFEAKTAEQAFYRGRELASAVLNLLKSPRPLQGTGLSFNSRTFKMPVENSGFIQLEQLGVLKRGFTDSVTTEVAYFEIGNASFATHPGETVPALSLETKAMMTNNGPKMILGLGMDALGYILKPYFFDTKRKIPHSPYLCSVSVGPNTEQFIREALQILIINSDSWK